MSQENVDLIRVVVESYRDPEIMRALADGDLDLSWVDPDVEWDASPLSEMVPDLAGLYHGHEGVRTFWRRWFDAWSALEFEIEDIRDADDDVVVLIRDQRQLGRHSEIWTELPPFAQVYTLRDGQLVRWQIFPDHESALAAVGQGR
ncbi:MAG TPA: nuclear transport factor 2 family protein [Solirubrobacterales bacterium]